MFRMPTIQPAAEATTIVSAGSAAWSSTSAMCPGARPVW